MRIKTFEQLDPTVRSTIRIFLATAVARKHLDQSWAVIAPDEGGLHVEGVDEGDRAAGCPVPGRRRPWAQFYLEYASRKEILVDVGLSQRPSVVKKRTRPVAFQLGLSPVGKGTHKRWLVSYWMPRWTPPVPVDKS